MRLAAILALTATPALADAVPLYGSDPAECGTFAEGLLTDDDFFPGGDAGTLTLVDPVRIATVPDAMLYEGAADDGGTPFRIGPVVVIREIDGSGTEVVRVFTASEPMQEHRVCPN
jgi:hypothetical protein